MSGNYPAKNGGRVSECTGASTSSEDDFPLVCETCLGSNPYLKMTKKPFGDKLCQISKVPFQGFKWKPGPATRYRETIVSRAVAVDRNICQSCLNDMQYGLPVGVRDAMLAQPTNKLKLPESAVSQAYYHQQTEGSNSSSSSSQSLALQLVNTIPDQQINQFSRQQHSAGAKQSTSFRNLPKLCSFWLNCRCERVKKGTCPFRPCCGSFLFPEIAQKKDLHQQLIDQLTAEGPAVVQTKLSKEVLAAFRDNMKGNREESIKKRVSGEDELSKQYVNKIKTMNATLEPPSDPFVITLFLGNIDEGLTEDHIKTAVYPYGVFTNVHILRSSKCAFVDYIDRPTAEQAARLMYNNLTIEGRVVSVNWAKPRANAAAPPGVSFVPAAGLPYPMMPMMPMMAPPGLAYAPPYAYNLQGMSVPYMTAPQPPVPGYPAAYQHVGQVRPRDDNETDASESNKRQYISSFSSSSGSAGSSGGGTKPPPPPQSSTFQAPSRLYLSR